MYYYSMDIQSLQVNHNIVSGHIGYLKHMHVGGDDVLIELKSDHSTESDTC